VINHVITLPLIALSRICPQCTLYIILATIRYCAILRYSDETAAGIDVVNRKPGMPKRGFVSLAFDSEIREYHEPASILVEGESKWNFVFCLMIHNDNLPRPLRL